MYSQLLEIVQDAVFGSDAVLTASQIFITEQLCVWLTIIVLVLPVFCLLGLVLRWFKIW